MGMEHGGFIRSPDSATWMNFTASLDMGWMEVAEIFRQCQDLLENNIVPKRPIEALVGKKNLETYAQSDDSYKGEIVKRILYQNPGVESIFCAGDDKSLDAGPRETERLNPPVPEPEKRQLPSKCKALEGPEPQLNDALCPIFPASLSPLPQPPFCSSVRNLPFEVPSHSRPPSVFSYYSFIIGNLPKWKDE
ncbi:hypothetical protein BDR06DRAFT_971081 [Suillus hirtellus]|nr:hypothetical protein BDR06DRAFT_971081 [Suillus hirtellus]